MILQKIFFSYSRSDGSDFALRLATDLKKEGFNVWIDQQDIRAGSEWDIEIEKALETCDCLLFVETEKSVSSNNVLDEVYYALEQRKKVIPLILRDSKTPFRLQRLQHIDFTRDYESGLAHLIKELRGNITAENLPPEEVKLFKKANKPFYIKYTGLLLIFASLVITIAAVITYKAKNRNTIPGTNITAVNSTDTITGGQQLNYTGTDDRKLIDVESASTSKQADERIKKPHEKEERIYSNKIANERDNKAVNNTDNKVNKTDTTIGNLNETFSGDWRLINVNPKAESIKGYLKIEAIDEKKVKIKSYVQFYYFKTNDTSFLSIFNAFAGCSTCILEEEMKITAEDIAIASHVYKTLKEDQPGNGKAGDTIMNAGSNKSISASVTLHLINNKTVVMKIQKPIATTLAYGLVLEPFVYSFQFTKNE